MKDELVSLETAKLAKEKGFEYKKCPIIYLGNSTTHKHDGLGFGSQYTAAPTQSLLQRWLREEYNLFVEINYNGDGGYRMVEWSDWNENVEKLKEFISNPLFFTTYEQALEEGLKEALKTL